jgi:Family of unknown function (DUF6029)
MKPKIAIFIFSTFFTNSLSFGQSEQKGGSFSGTFDTNANVFLRDSSINAINIPQYDHQFFGGEAWLNLNYQTKDLLIGARFDMYNNSNLQNPKGSYSGLGIGNWYIKKTIKKLQLNAGYLYDQIGSGFIFRSFENRPLFIDNALFGVSAKVDLGKSWSAMAFAGRQKNIFETYAGNIKGARIEGFVSLGTEDKPFTMAPGIGFVGRTISDDVMKDVKDVLRTYQIEDRFEPTHNTYSGTVYNTVSYGPFNLYAELSLKSNDIFDNPFAIKKEIIGTVLGKLEKKPGSIIYGSLSYSKGKIGITVEAKRTENFTFRIDPNLKLLRGVINYLAPINRQNTYRLTARYSPSALDISEQAFVIDAKYKVNKSLSVGLNFSNIIDLDGDQLFREVFTEVLYKHKRKWQLTTGLQFVNYNQEVYEGKSEVPIVKTIVPYADFLYRFTPKKSLRTELQYMQTKEDFGSWIYGLLEYNLAPKWSFEASGMYNNKPKKGDKIFYPTLGAVFYHDTQRYSIRYVKQVEGVVCSGGICRLEPAFSGIRMQMNTTF